MEIHVFFGLILGLAGGIAITSFFFKKKSERHIKEQSVLLLDKIKQVCKLITVEGEFSELFSHRDEKNLFFKLVQLETKALIIIKAKVLIGFDLTKINIEINSNSKQVKLSSFPDPEILSIDSDIEYYDVQKGIINKFSETDLTNLNKKSKDFIRDKVERSQLIAIAKNQANDTISIIRQLIESVGWELTADKILERIKKEKILDN
jgi:hypothetical protein